MSNIPLWMQGDDELTPEQEAYADKLRDEGEDAYYLHISGKFYAGCPYYNGTFEYYHFWEGWDRGQDRKP